MSTETTSFLHAGSIGDCIASIPAINECYRKTGKKGIIYFQKDLNTTYYPGATHPTRNSSGEMVLLNEAMIEMMIPLFKAQESIADARVWNDEKIDCDFNIIRNTFVGMPNFCLSRWYFYTFPDLACDLSKQWLFVPDNKTDLARGKILISRTERYNNDLISYEFIKKHESDLLFTGTKKEHNLFCINNDLDIPKLGVTNFLELAQAIKQSRFHISNQTMTFQISQGLKHPRMVELCQYAPNVLVTGEDAYDFFAQAALEYYVDVLAKKYPA